MCTGEAAAEPTSRCSRLPKKQTAESLCEIWHKLPEVFLGMRPYQASPAQRTRL